MSSDDRRMILEHFDKQFALLLENIDSRINQRVRPIVQEELAEMKADIKTIKTAVKETNADILDHEQHITTLEATA